MSISAAAENCGASCQSRVPCFSGTDTKQESKAYFAWDRARIILPSHKNGTLCLADGLKRTQLVDACNAWWTRTCPDPGEDDADWVDPVDGFATCSDWSSPEECREVISGMSPPEVVIAACPKTCANCVDPAHVTHQSPDGDSAEGPHLNITDCEELEEVIDDSCGFDPDPVRSFTRDLGWHCQDNSNWVDPVHGTATCGYWSGMLTLKRQTPMQILSAHAQTLRA